MKVERVSVSFAIIFVFRKLLSFLELKRKAICFRFLFTLINLIFTHIRISYWTRKRKRESKRKSISLFYTLKTRWVRTVCVYLNYFTRVACLEGMIVKRMPEFALKIMYPCNL